MNYIKVKKVTNNDLALRLDDKESWENEAIFEHNCGIEDIVGGYTIEEKDEGLIEKEDVKGKKVKIEVVQYIHGRVFRDEMEAITNSKGTWVAEDKLF